MRQGHSGCAQASSMAARTAPALLSVSLHLGLGVRVGHDPAPGLEVHLAVLDEARADVDAGVELARVGQVADGAAVGAALHGLDLVDDLHGADLGGARQRACGQRGAHRVHGADALAQRARHRRDDVHDVGVGLHGHELVHVHRAVLAHAPEVVAAEVHEHHVLGPLLGVGEQLPGAAGVPLHGVGPRARAGEGALGDAAPVDLHERLGRGPGDLEVLEVEEVHVGARVDRAQPAVDREALHGRGAAPALAGHDLVGVPRADVLLHDVHGRGVAAGAEARHELGGLAPRPHGARHGTGQALAHVGDGPHGVGVASLELLARVHVGHDGDRVLEVVEGQEEVGDHEGEVGHPERIGPGGADRGLGVAGEVVAEDADGAAGERRQVGAGRGAQPSQLVGHRGVGIGGLARLPAHREDPVLEADDRARLEAEE